MLNKVLAERLKRIVINATYRVSVTFSLIGFMKDFNIGSLKGKSIHFTSDDHTKIKEILIKKGYSLDVVVNNSMSRVEKLSHGPNEKAGGGGLKTNRISIKAAGSNSLLINGESLKLPSMSHMDIEISQLLNTQHNCIVLVENYENFNRFSEAELQLPEHLNNPLVIYRGDKNESRLDAVLRYIASSGLPLLAAVDIDPYGLVNILKMPGLIGVLAPEANLLQPLLSTNPTRRADLYEHHYLGCNALLDALLDSHACKRLWMMVKANKAGVVQEQFVRLKLPLVLW